MQLAMNAAALPEDRRLAIDVHSDQADEFAARYERLNRDAYSSCFAYSRHRLEHYINEYLPPDGSGYRLLDIGCGTGHYLARFRERGFEVAGVDGSDRMLMHAQSLNPGIDIRLADVERLPFDDACFDYVICVEVLRYLPATERCIAEIRRVLKPAGTCLATAVPLFNLNGYWAVNRLASYMRIANLVRLKQFFTTERRLRQTFKEGRFSQVQIHGVYVGPINWIERIIPRMLPALLQKWQPLDRVVADLPIVRELANMFFVAASCSQ